MTIRQRLFRSHLEDNEKILYTAHRTLFVLFTDFMKITFLGIIVPLILTLIFPKIYPVAIIWVAVGSLKLLYTLFNWYFDAWLITDLGIIDVQWNGPFNRTATRIEYQNIGGVTYEIKGFFPTVLNFGDLYVTDLGTAKIDLLAAKKPRKIENRIMEQQEKFLSKQNFEDQNKLKDLLTSLIRNHIETNGMPTTNNIKKK